MQDCGGTSQSGDSVQKQLMTLCGRHAFISPSSADECNSLETQSGISSADGEAEKKRETGAMILSKLKAIERLLYIIKNDERPIFLLQKN